MRKAVYHGPLGPLTLTEENGRITSLDWHDRPGEGSDLLNEAVAQLAAYFDGRLTRFDLPLEFGEGLNADIRRAMSAIPYGETRTYGDIAKDLGIPAQAVGQGCGANTIPVIIPCHRVLGATNLGGFSAKGGVETKVALLKLEGAASLLI
ncbi:MAG: cysteine methyltransferase [Cereibacter sphaeroides]|uniref:Cysteine methyltransferase n=1 Tax=Cereibacter sphaeroides TaxID=1063 RepID=A0A2W5US00_CERSP|nr:MAG: cysteine methyltransferase [Cereibacter sphaeroides]